MKAAIRSTWQGFVLAGVVLCVLLATIGFGIERSAVEVGEPKALPYASDRRTPFEVEVHLHHDHSIVIADGDQDLWYFAALVVLALTLGAAPLVHARQRDRSPDGNGSSPAP